MIAAMAQGLLSRRWLLAWLIVLGYLAAVAHYARAQSLSALAARLTAQLTPYAEREVEKPARVWPKNDYLSECQGPMVYLIERGYRDPAMLRVMLLCEARRSYDMIYLYDHCFNWDLRTHLVEECTRAFPDDPLVHWAAGRCLLTGGEYDRAADELLAAERLGFDPQAAGVKAKYFAGRIETALLMAGRGEEVIARGRARVNVFLQSPDVHDEYSGLLTRLGRYEDSDAAIADWRRACGEDYRQHLLGLRNAWWSRDLPEFERRAHAAADDVGDLALLDWASIRLALLKGNFELAELLVGGRNEKYWRALAETYAFTGNEELLPQFEADMETAAADYDGLRGVAGASDARGQAADRLSIAETNLLRARMLRGDWDAVIGILDDRRWKGYSNRTEKTYDFAMLMAHIAVSYEYTKRWRWFNSRTQLPWLLNSEVLAQAAADGGYDLQAARSLVLAELPVSRGDYSDFSNGSLDW